jgi:putative sterol carrier protein
VLAVNPIEELKQRFNPEAAQKVSATYLFQITGEAGGVWVAKINNGTLEVTPFDASVRSEQPDCSISVAAEDLSLMMSGKLSAMTAALSGMLSIEGELGLAMQLVPIFFNGQGQIF